MNKSEITVSAVMELLEYDDSIGRLVWRVNRGSAAFPGKTAGTETSYGSLQLSLLGCRLQISHVVWFIHYGRWPNPRLVVDHIDRNPKNNRISNLREVTKEVNILHDIHKNSKQGIYETSRGRWAVVVESNGLSVCVGAYDSEVVATRKLKKEI